ncbi:MAG TPA: cation diffusion facilitator family transporter [Vicinamibacterales bacterium]|nr:cation diffusion facilitator family transporter [Vicinamibacterales bacterium]
MTPDPADPLFLRRYAWLSIVAALVTMALKAAAYLLTGSVGLLSDAVESLVNLAGALMALWMLTVAAREPDEDHAYGHTKAEYFSSGAEGTLILFAALSIAFAAVQRLLAPRPLDALGIGVAVSAAASFVNLVVARVLLRAGRRFHSVTLEADARHLLTDVWTSAGVLVALGAVYLTGWLQLDPIVALAVAANIVVTGFRIVRDSVRGLMDTALPAQEREQLRSVLERHAAQGIQYHALRTRRSGVRRFVSVHVLVPGEWSVHRGHELLEQVESDIRTALPGTTVFTHLESIEDSSSWDDQSLDRGSRGQPRLDPAARPPSARLR